MKVKLELNHKEFTEFFGFSESFLTLNDPNYFLSESVYCLDVWGIDFRNSFLLKHFAVSLAKEKFLTNENGIIVSIKSEWESTENEKTNHSKCYRLGSISTFPYGYCEVDIIVSDTVIVEIDTKHFISVNEYVSNPSKYSFKKI